MPWSRSPNGGRELSMQLWLNALFPQKQATANPAVRGAPSLRRNSGRVIFSFHQATAQHVGERLDAQFNKHKRLGDKVRAAAEARTRAALEIGEACHKDDWRVLARGQRANLCAEFKSIH